MNDSKRINRPRFSENADTQQYWYERIRDAKERLEFTARSQQAVGFRRRFAQYVDRRKPNAISRKLQTKIDATVSEAPIATPVFREEDDELAWFEKIESYAAEQIRRQQMRGTLRNLCWDNYFAGIGWLSASLATRTYAGTPVKAAEAKEQALGERMRIDGELQLALGGQLPTVGAGDLHELHIEAHETHLRDLLKAAAVQPELQTAANLIDVHLSDHRALQSPTEAETVRAERIPPWLVTYDPDALTWADADWYAIEHCERLEVLRLNRELRHTSSLRGAPGLGKDIDQEQAAGSDEESTTAGLPGAESWIRYWVIHSRVDDQLIIIADLEHEGQRPLRVSVWPYHGDLVRPLVLNPVLDQIHGVPECQRMQGAHDQLEVIRERINNYVRHVPPAKWLVPSQVANNPEFLTKFRAPDQVFMDSQGLGKDDFIEVHFPQVDKTLIDEAERLEAELDDLSGIPEWASGGQADETATLTAARDRMMGNRLQADKQEIGDLVAWWLEQMVAILRTMGTVEQFVRIVGDAGRSWERFLPSDIPHGISWLVDSDSLSPTRREMEKKQQLELLAALQPYMDPMRMAIIDPRAILGRTIRQFRGPEDLSEVFVQPVDPMLLQQQATQMGGDPSLMQSNDPTQAGVVPDQQPAAQTGSPAYAGGAQMASAVSV